MKLTRQRPTIALVILAAVAAFGLLAFLNREIRTSDLAEGGTLMIPKVVATATNFEFAERSKLYRDGFEMLPWSVRSHLLNSLGAKFQVGSDGRTNLVLIGILEERITRSLQDPLSLRFLGREGEGFEPDYSTTIYNSSGTKTYLAWSIDAFPRRSRFLDLRFLDSTNGGWWTKAADVRIKNPLYANYPQWTPEPWPITKTNQGVAISLRDFQTGFRQSRQWGVDKEATSTAKTQFSISFAENGQTSGNFRVVDVIMSDATGNLWHPKLLKNSGEPVPDEKTEFAGELWPDERAWKLGVGFVRKAGFNNEELREFKLEMPAPGGLLDLIHTPEWKHPVATVQLFTLGSLSHRQTGNFAQLAYWRHVDGEVIYALGLNVKPASEEVLISLARGVDQNGTPVKMLGQSRTLPSGERVLFLKPATNASHLHLTLALQRNRYVEFLARPQFVNTVTNSVR